ncbi:MAG TPA: glycosyltransferase [Caulobacteraceae bacterium]|jgi:glycosyltransferase involved in cell wall biosynthesis|nr:glycosyltransferase [Caulobacteraceae bacterium]
MSAPPPTLHLLGSSGEGGAETYFVDLVSALKGAGLPTQAAIRANAGREAALAAVGVETAVLPFGGLFDFSTRGGVARTAEIMGARVLVAWMSRAARHAPGGPWRRVGRLGGYYDLKYYRGFDRLVGNTRDICDWIVDQGWPAARVSYIPNFAEAGDAQPLDRATLDTPKGVPLLLGMGRLHPSKAHDVSLAALAQIPDAFLWIAGSGPLEAALKAKASELGVADRVRFLGWRSDAGALYRTADVCVFPSRYEPLGNTVIQAWAHGLPVVAAASKGPASLIRDGEDGRLTPIDDVDAFASAVRALIADASLRTTLADAGCARAGAEFSRDAVVAQWRALFDACGDASCAA